MYFLNVEIALFGGCINSLYRSVVDDTTEYAAERQAMYIGTASCSNDHISCLPTRRYLHVFGLELIRIYVSTVQRSVPTRKSQITHNASAHIGH